MIRLVFRLAVLMLFTFSLKAAAENTASGTLTVNGSDTELKHAFVDERGPDLIMVLTDKTVTPGDIPFGLNNLAVEDKVRAIVFTISKETKELTPGLNAIYHPICEGQLGTIGNGVLTLSKFDNNEITGKISTPNENTFGNYKFSYAVSFAAKLGQPKKTEPLTVEIQGADDPPSKAYAEYYRALMSGDKDELRRHLASDILKEADEETINIVIELTQAMNPTTLKITGSEVKDNEALLKAEWLCDGQESTGSIQMKLEDGSWKVVKDSWDGKMN